MGSPLPGDREGGLWPSEAQRAQSINDYTGHAICPGGAQLQLLRPAARGQVQNNIYAESVTLPAWNSNTDTTEDHTSVWQALATSRNLAELRALTYRELDSSGAWRRTVAAIAEYTDFLDLIEFGDAGSNVVATLAINEGEQDVGNLGRDCAAYTFGFGNRWLTTGDTMWAGGTATKIRRRSVTTPSLGGVGYHDVTYEAMTVELLFVPVGIKIS